MSAPPEPKDDPPLLPPRPEPPDPSDCCMSGCLRCVYDLYDLNLERWEEQVASIRARQMQPKD
ncbi:hypothetical protein E4T66_00060 [Sinimarinibacterium sp. CAU 1509]|uniref:oxidoreductase-like domain-containing protein n=1 Tax=Sinimarinibacterium sp. CAU 1509 TaxID=2562283 RepID=UPI0010AB77C5|nr:oxidoreductase-like domain-containing protein [Sinimarinibacterium sp. CAU 1509]TJY64682.1 hypothetical protein E4T66_00060 [Sinimarinibacterium sp. CAU 1509]